MMTAAVAGVLALLALGGARAGAAFALGAGLAMLNFRWLHQAVRALMNAGQARPPRALILKFLIRYPLAFGVVYLVYRTGWLPLLPALAGLFVPVAGVMCECVLLVREGFREASLDTDSQLTIEN
jgi:F1-F0 ATPase (N-ATPase) AtpR subunit